jgi:hypothetical protein
MAHWSVSLLCRADEPVTDGFTIWSGERILAEAEKREVATGNIGPIKGLRTSQNYQYLAL